MSTLWLEEIDPHKDWTPFELSGPAFRLLAGDNLGVEPVDLDKRHSLSGDILLVRARDQADSRWSLLCSPSACCVNGEPVAAGLRSLLNHDEIRLRDAGLRFFYSTEVVASITRHAGDPFRCPRCLSEILDGHFQVVCPRCNIAHHQDASISRPCWAYTAQCAVCKGPTELDSGYTWPPENF